MIEFITGGITILRVDAIVNAANTGLVGGAGLCGMVHDAAGPELDIECKRLKYCLRGEAKVTRGYNLPAKYIIHTVGPIYGQHNGREAEILYSCYYESMRLANNLMLKSIAFPYVSTGMYEYPIKLARKIASDAIEDFLADNINSAIEIVYLVEFDDSEE